MRLQDYEFRRQRVKGQQVNKTTRQQDFYTCGLVVSLSRSLYTLHNLLLRALRLCERKIRADSRDSWRNLRDTRRVFTLSGL